MDRTVTSAPGVGLVSAVLGLFTGGTFVATVACGLSTLACAAAAALGVWGVVEVLGSQGEYLWEGLKFVVALFPAAFALALGSAAAVLAQVTATCALATGGLGVCLVVLLGFGGAQNAEETVGPATVC